MVSITKHEWHGVDSSYSIELSEDLLADIYPELDDEAISEKLKQIKSGEISVDDIIADAENNEIDLEWNHVQDDMYTDRQGGYEITYELDEGN